MTKKILVIRFSSIGDIVLTTPVVRALAKAGYVVHYLTKPVFADIVMTNPYVTKVITYSQNFESMIRILKAEDYDHIIDLHHNLRSARIKLSLRKPSSAFNKLNFEKWLMVNFKINRLPDLHIVDRYFRTARKFGVRNDGKGLDFFIPPEKMLNVRERFGFDKFIAIVIGAAHETKCMTAAQIATICALIKTPVILLGGKQEITKGNEILEVVKSGHVRSACGQLDLYESASVIEQAGAVITHDTGLMHIAAALQKPQIVVWGNTIPEFGMIPYYGSHQVKWYSFEVAGLSCRPCSKLGYKECPKGHFKCMLEQPVQHISNAACEIFEMAEAEKKYGAF